MKPKAAGVVVPLLTPFTEDGAVDYQGLESLLTHIIGGGADGIFQLSTSGEYVRLTPEEKAELAACTMRLAKGKITTYLGISDASLEQVLANIRAYEPFMPDFFVCSLPYYYPVLAEEEIVGFFEEVIKASPVPVVLYNIPVTCGGKITLPALEKLLALPNLAGIKDSSGDRDYLQALAVLKQARPDFTVLVGNEGDILFGLEKDCDGMVPSMGNAFPEIFAALQQTFRAGDWQSARALQQIVDGMNKLNAFSPSWMSAMVWRKAALAQMQICGQIMRQPCAALPQTQQENLMRILSAYQSLLPLFAQVKTGEISSEIASDALRHSREILEQLAV